MVQLGLVLKPVLISYVQRGNTVCGHRGMVRGVHPYSPKGVDTIPRGGHIVSQTVIMNQRGEEEEQVNAAGGLQPTPSVLWDQVWKDGSYSL